MTAVATSNKRKGEGRVNKVVPFPLVTDFRSMAHAVSMRAGAGSCPVTVECIRTTSALEQVAEEWSQLFHRSECRNAFLSVEWMSSWWRHWGGGHRLMIILVRDREGQLVAVAPLYLRRSRLGAFGPRALCFIGTQWVGSDHLDLLVAPGYEESAIEAIVGAVRAQCDEWDYIELADGAEDSPVFSRLCRAFKGAGMVEQFVHEEACPYTPLPTSFDELLAGLGSNQRYNFRRRRRALEREAGIEFRSVQGGPELYERFADVVRLHRLRFDNQRRNTFFPASAIQSFHIDALHQLEANGMARVFFLQSKGKVIAALYGFSVGKTFAFYQCGMDPAWSRLSVGLVMMGCAIEEAIRTGHDEFDFLRGDDAYKFQWTKKIRRGITRCFFDQRIRSQWARPHIWARDGIKQAVRRFLLPLLGRLRFGEAPQAATANPVATAEPHDTKTVGSEAGSPR